MNIIIKVEATLTLPKAGDVVTVIDNNFNTQSPQPTVTIPDNSNYIYNYGFWYTDPSTVEDTIFNGQFEEGKTYYAFLMFRANDDYAFCEKTTIELNSGTLIPKTGFDEEYDDKDFCALIEFTIPKSNENAKDKQA